MPVDGFPRGVRSTPVPNPVFGPLLEEFDDLAELKCTLRVIWRLHQKKGAPRYVTLKELLADRVLAAALTEKDQGIGPELRRALALAVKRGTLLTTRTEINGVREQIYLLNTEAARSAVVEGIDGEQDSLGPDTDEEAPRAAAERPNIFALYENNIGVLSPMIAEELKEAERNYPQAWIEEAIREAVTGNRRSWRTVASILDRWQREGKGDGAVLRSSQKTGYQDYFRR